jgi:glycosyltransferase involved in cell wall biosynthesis
VKISVLIPSRTRIDKLRNSVTALQSLASGNHEIIYAIGCDSDDPETVHSCAGFDDSVRAYVMNRRGSLGQIVNILSEKYPADVYCSWADDIEMLEPGWDQIVADAVSDYPDWVFFWKAKIGKVDTTYAVVPEAWRKAAGRIFTDYFPFWFDDSWLMQLWQYAKGMDAWIALDAKVRETSVLGGKTHRLHDYPFWEEFFWERDGERLEEAAKIGKVLGWPPVENPEQFRLGRGVMFTQEQLDYRSEGWAPRPEYIAAKKRAEALMMS